MAEVKTGDFVVPGDLLATSEEFIPGDGAYEEDGKIYSSIVGVALVDTRAKKISVFPRMPSPPVLKHGDVVVGRVEEVRDQSVTVHIGVLRGREDRQLPSPSTGIIHISHVRRGFTRGVSKQFRPGDIVRARILNATREPAWLSTEGDDLGVILALCSRCRSTLEVEGGKLKCPSCGNVESRKLASDYRRGAL